ncbi:MarR family winged helix-turn-helix transcriptional regulator [Phytohabitans sp. ZYX-F-186]|uniref:MarR family winged helix-turn-helix transcriptional regulator n=1 Tax=Phytohabitans maris TaxID=3071409 RepID=A0ABU0ZH38_9ACTN|nr:MarR family winged helix-turn-helix transcriptional regulator [Phytohabitans sp. ZYX-F-186]MDQ7906378.1 MarR family winged helix-turn-helix transcriptional regulator [Phytohabitans sp. ZYX-F-186]
MTTPRPAYDGDFGWHLGVLLSGYQSLVVTVLGDFPHGPRGYQTLAAVVHGDQPSQLALATHLGIDRTVMTYLIDDLVEAGLVERQLNPADRRQRKIVATARGLGTYRDLERRVREAEDTLLGALEPAERRALRHLLRRVACDVRDIEPATDPCEAVGATLEGSAKARG